jgi:hypothetical protein
MTGCSSGNAGQREGMATLKTRQLTVITRLLGLNLDARGCLWDEDLDQLDAMITVEDAKVDLRISRVLKKLADPDCWNNPSFRSATIKSLNQAIRHDTRLDMLRQACCKERNRRMESAKAPLGEQVTVIEVEYRAACTAAKPVIRNTAA